MASFRVSEREIKKLARSGEKFEYNARGYILISWGPQKQHHVRFDLAQFENGRYQQLVGQNYEYLLTSFHIKREVYWSNDEQDYDYLYFSYVGGGVWQPVWGYQKTEVTKGGGRPRAELSDAAWGKGCELAHGLLEDLARATNTSQGVAAGPILGAQDNLVGQL